MADTALAGILVPSQYLVIGHAYHVYGGVLNIFLVTLEHTYVTNTHPIHSERGFFVHVPMFLTISGLRVVLIDVTHEYYFVVVHV